MDRPTLDVQAYLRVLVFVGFIGSSIFGAQWLTLPKELTKATAEVAVVEARVVGSKWPQVQFLRKDGTSIYASCGRVYPLCKQIGESSLKQLVIWFIPLDIASEPWILLVESENQVLLDEEGQKIAFENFRVKPAIIAAMFLLLSIFALLYAGYRKNRDNHA